MWIPTERLSEVFVVELTFRKGRSRMIATHKGRTVLLERGYEVPLEKKVRCRLEENSGGIYAIPLMLTESASSSENAMVQMKDAFNKAGFTNSNFIVVDVIKTKPGVAQVTCEDDVVVTQKYMDVYEILSNARLGIKVDASSSEREIKRAFTKQVSKVHPDTTLRSYKDRGVEPPVLMRMLAVGAHKRLSDAYERAIKLLEPTAPAEAEDTGKVGDAEATPAEVTEVQTQTDEEALRAKRSAAAKKAAATRKRNKEEAAAKAAGDAPASPEVSADATSVEVSASSEPAKKPDGEPEGRIEAFKRKYATSGTASATPKDPKPEAPVKTAAEGKGSFQDQLAGVRANVGSAK